MHGADEVVVAPGLFAFAESERNRDLTARPKPLTPERVIDFDFRKRDRLNGIARLGGLNPAAGTQRRSGKDQKERGNGSLHKKLF